MCFSPSSPVPSAKVLRPSESPTLSNSSLGKQSLENLKIQPKYLGETQENQQATIPVIQTISPSDISLEIGLKEDVIPILNIIPSSPLPFVTNTECPYEQAIENAEKQLTQLKDKKKQDNNNVREDSSKDHSGGQNDANLNRSKLNELALATSNAPTQNDTPTKTHCVASGNPVPVIMKIEHINDDNPNLKNTEQFPVVTRRFRQLPIQCSKENLEETLRIAQDISNAQSNVTPSSDIKRELSESAPDTGAEVCEQQDINTKVLISNDNTITSND